MQIQYCEECGTRVDDAEAVNIAGKSYCRQCAPSHVPAQKTGGTAVLLGGPRSSTRAQRTQRTTPVRNLASGASPLTNGIVGINSSYGLGDEASTDSAKKAAPTTPNSRTTILDAAYNWALSNKAMAIALAAGLISVLLVVIWSFSSSKPRFVAPIAPKIPAAPILPGAANSTVISDTTVVSTVTTVSAIPPDPAVIPPPPPDAVTPREAKAIRDLQEIKDLIAAGKISPLEIRKRLTAFVNYDKNWRKTQAFGAEAAQMLEKYKNEKRPPDNAEGAKPGATVALSNDKALQAFNTDFKPVEIKTIKEISFTNAAALKAAFGRDTNLALKFTGFIDVPKDGEYTFYVSSDDGSMLYLGNSLLIDNGGSHAMQERSESAVLKAGKHTFRLEYYQGISEAGLLFSWSGPGIVKQIVPATALYSTLKKP